MTAPQSQAVSARANRWHQSTLSNLLDGCSWQYFLTYVIGLDTGKKPHAAIGTAYHSAVELHEKNRMNNKETTREEMEEYAIKQFTKTIKQDDPEFEELSANVKAAIGNWYEYHRPQILEWTPVAIEPEFTLPLVDAHKPIGGYIDAIYRDRDNNTFIVDHKTAKNFDRWRDADGHRTQAAMYATALVLSPDFPEITELPEMVYMVSRTSTSNRKDFEKGRTLKVQPTIEDVRLLGDRIRAAEVIVATESYERKPEWPLCSPKWCAFYQGCQVDKTLAGSPTFVKLSVRQQNIKSHLNKKPSLTKGYRQHSNIVTQDNNTGEV